MLTLDISSKFKKISTSILTGLPSNLVDESSVAENVEGLENQLRDRARWRKQALGLRTRAECEWR